MPIYYNWGLISKSLFHIEHKFWCYYTGIKIFLIVSSKFILIFLNSTQSFFKFSQCVIKLFLKIFTFLLIFPKYFSKFSEIISKNYLKILKKIAQFSKILREIFLENISWNFPKYFSKMSKPLTLMLGNKVVFTGNFTH